MKKEKEKEEEEKEATRDEGGKREGRKEGGGRREERGREGQTRVNGGRRGEDGCLQGQLSVAYLTSPGTDTRRRTLLITGGRLNPVHTLALYTCVCVGGVSV